MGMDVFLLRIWFLPALNVFFISLAIPQHHTVNVQLLT